MNKSLITWIVVLMPLAIGLFYMKHTVQKLETDLAALQKSIKSDQEEIHVARAEWTYLTRPSRIKDLSGKYLNLQITNSSQIVDVDSLPSASAANVPAEGGVITRASVVERQ